LSLPAEGVAILGKVKNQKSKCKTTEENLKMNPFCLLNCNVDFLYLIFDI